MLWSWRYQRRQSDEEVDRRDGAGCWHCSSSETESHSSAEDDDCCTSLDGRRIRRFGRSQRGWSNCSMQGWHVLTCEESHGSLLSSWRRCALVVAAGG